jgi:hypothetical protein
MVEATKATPLVIGAAAATGSTGALLGLAAVQLWGNLQLLGAFRYVPWGMLGLCAALLVVAAKLYRQRLWAAQLAIALGLLSSVSGAMWFILALLAGLFTLYGMMLPVVGLGTAVLGFLTLPQVRTAAEARRTLERDGVLTDF